MIDKFTICVLLFGDHFDLAQRCLSSIVNGVDPQALNLRIGLNAVTDETRKLAYALAPHSIWEFTENRHKYPVMREMVHGVSPIRTPYTMWFDDDSYLVKPTKTLLSQIDGLMPDADMLGSLYRIPWQGNQKLYVQAQPWYAGRDLDSRPKIKFATGGWWTIRTEVLYRFDYPWPLLDHRGGDVMLGEMCYQQGLRLKHFRDGVKINADHTGRESKAPRRGFDQLPLGVDFDPSISAALHRATSPSPAIHPKPQPKLRPLIEL